MWFVIMSVIAYVEHCSYFSVVTVVRLLNSVVCGYQCYYTCRILQVIFLVRGLKNLLIV